MGRKLCYLPVGTNVDHFCSSGFMDRGEEFVATNLLVNTLWHINDDGDDEACKVNVGSKRNKLS